MSSNVTLLNNRVELWAEYQDLLERAIKLAVWYGHDLDAALGEHVSRAGDFPPVGVSNQDTKGDGG